MKKIPFKVASALLVSALLLFISCKPAYVLTKAEGRSIAIDSTWDALPDAETLTLVGTYKTQLDSFRHRVVGTAAMTMEKKRPESLLSNLVSDVLRQAAASTLGKPADMGLINTGGLRNILTEGTILCEHIYEILPFENSLCILHLKGEDLKKLFADIAVRKGEGVSGVRLEISESGTLLSATVAGEPVDDNRTYTVATIDYLADGNDGMNSLLLATQRECPEKMTLRDLFMQYVEQQTAAGNSITSKQEGRIIIR